MLAIDIVLAALIGPPGCAADMVLERSEAGEWSPVILDLAIFCAMMSVRPEERVDHARFARLLRHATFAASHGRAEGEPFAPPSPEEIEHWRDVALGRQRDD